MTKCKGCGITMQSTDPNIEGYVVGSKDYCERCFKLKHYGTYDKKVRTNEEFIDILKHINKSSLVVLILDIFNLPENLDLIKENITNKILLVLTKKDIFKDISDNKLLDYMDNYKIDFIDKIVISSQTNYHLDEFKNMLIKYNQDNNIYFIGYTNSGKSTLINKLLTTYSDSKEQVTTSIMPSTTLDFITIPFNGINIIDTPGLLNEHNIDMLLDPNDLKKIIPNKKIVPIIYQIRRPNYFSIQSILDIQIDDNNIIMYFNSDLDIGRYYVPKDDLEFTEYKVKANTDLVIGGLGFIKFLKPGTVRISSKYNLNIFVRKSLL